MNKNKNNKKFSKLRRKRGRRRRNRPGIKESMYSADIRLTTYSWNLGQATGFPLLLRLGAFFGENVRLQQCCTLFQQYKLMKIRVSVIPEIYQGSTPFIVYMLCSTDREIDTTSELILSKGVRCSNVRPFTKTISSSGRQNDFNYWFDCRNINEADKRPTVQIAFAPDSYGRVPSGSYVITIIASFRFRYPQSIVPPTIASGGNGREGLKEEEKVEEKKEEVKENKKEEKKIEDPWELTGEDDDLEYENEKLREELKKLKEEMKKMKIQSGNPEKKE